MREKEEGEQVIGEKRKSLYEFGGAVPAIYLFIPKYETFGTEETKSSLIGLLFAHFWVFR